MLYHAALPQDWAAALTSGRYEVSTRGQTLAQVGFIHASYLHQVERIVNLFFGDVEELVLLVIEPSKLGAKVVEESGTDSPNGEHFPHIYGPLPVDAVIDIRPLRRGPHGFRL